MCWSHQSYDIKYVITYWVLHHNSDVYHELTCLYICLALAVSVFSLFCVALNGIAVQFNYSYVFYHNGHLEHNCGLTVE